MARTFDISIKPDEARVEVALKGFNQQALDAVHFRLVQGANNIRNKMINRMRRTPKTGKRYKRGKRWHIASSPGNAPAVDTGQLIRSIVMDERIDEIEVGVKSGAPYAIYLEDPDVLNRPSLTPAVNDEVPKMERKILQDLERMKL